MQENKNESYQQNGIPVAFNPKQARLLQIGMAGGGHILPPSPPFAVSV